MLFQVLDNKQECRGVFYGGQIITDYKNSDLDLSHSWAPTEHFRDHKVEYAQLWALGKSLKDVCPEKFLTAYTFLDNKARAFLKSFSAAKINLNDVCIPYLRY